MFAKILFLVVILLELNSMFIGFPKCPMKLTYSALIKNSNLGILSGETEFCKYGDVQLWAAICRQVLINYGHKKLYLDYQSFTPIAAISKCQKRTVMLGADYYHYDLPAKEVDHHMAVCPCRTLIVPKIRKGRNKNYTDVIAITPHPESKENVLVFEKNNVINKYVIVSMYRNAHYRKVPEILFTQPPPTSSNLRTDLYYALRKLEASLKTGTSENSFSNIVDKSDKYLFARLCFMTSKTAGRRSTAMSMSQLCNEKPTGKYLKVNTNIIEKPFINDLLIYPCGPPEEFVQPDSEDILQKWKKLKDLHSLSRGPNNNSLIMYTYKKEAITNFITLKPLELIENVFEEFLWEIRIPNEVKKECEPPATSESVESDYIF